MFLLPTEPSFSVLQKLLWLGPLALSHFWVFLLQVENCISLPFDVRLGPVSGSDIATSGQRHSMSSIGLSGIFSLMEVNLKHLLNWRAHELREHWAIAQRTVAARVWRSLFPCVVFLWFWGVCVCACVCVCMCVVPVALPSLYWLTSLFLEDEFMSQEAIPRFLLSGRLAFEDCRRTDLNCMTLGKWLPAFSGFLFCKSKRLPLIFSGCKNWTQWQG